jgi:hypothetical protein
MKISIQDINKKLETFFEGKLNSVFNKNPLTNLTEKLINSIEMEVQENAGIIFIPNNYIIKIKEKTQLGQDELMEWKRFAKHLIKEFSEEKSCALGGPIKIEILYDETIEDMFVISSHKSNLSSGDTISLSLEVAQNNKINSELIAFLILWDEEYFKINKKILNIGRQESNDLVIDNLRVSRIHAQIIHKDEEFFIIDTNSTSGTRVNGHIIKKHQLSNGDVIEIADVPLIFSQNEKKHKNTRTKLLKIDENRKGQ